MLIFSGTRSAYRKARGAIGRAGRASRRRAATCAQRRRPRAPASSEDGVALAVADDLPVSEWHHGHHGRPGHHHHKHPEPDAFMDYGRGPRSSSAWSTDRRGNADAGAHLPDGRHHRRQGGGGGRAATFIVGLLMSNTMITRVDLRVPSRIAELEDLCHRGDADGHVWIGCSVHSEREAESAVRQGADFLMVGSIFPTPSHPSRPAAGPGLIRRCVGYGVPVIAIGGIGPARVPEVMEAGAYGVAAISALWRAADPAGETIAMLKPWVSAP